MGARLIDKNNNVVKKVMVNSAGVITACKKQYERVNGALEPTYYDGYVLYNGLTTDGTAYIDLGRKGYGNNTHIIDFTLTDLSTYVGIYGDRIGDGKRLGIVYFKDSDDRLYIGNNNGGATNLLTLATPTVGRYKATISATKTTILHNGILEEKNYTAPMCSETNSSLKVFRYRKPAETPITYFQGISTVHSIKEYSSSGVLLYHYVPARRNSDNALGLLDVVNGVFYTNAGSSGSFTV